MDVGSLFEDFGLIETRYDTAKLQNESSLEDKATNDAIELGAEEIEVVDNVDGSVNVCFLFFHLYYININFPTFTYSSYAVQWF